MKIVDIISNRKKEKNTAKLLNCVESINPQRSESFKKLLLKAKGNFDHEAVTEGVEDSESFRLTQALIESGCCTSESLKLNYDLYKTIKSPYFSSMDINIVKKLLQSGANANTTFGKVSLMDIALKKNDWKDLLDVLLDAGAHIGLSMLTNSKKTTSNKEIEEKLLFIMKKGVKIGVFCQNQINKSLQILLEIYNNPNACKKYLTMARNSENSELLEKYAIVAKYGITKELKTNPSKSDKYSRLYNKITETVEKYHTEIKERISVRNQAEIDASKLISGIKKSSQTEEKIK